MSLLFRWFVGLGMDDAVWHHAVFSKNRDRLLSSAVAQQFFSSVNRQAKRFMSELGMISFFGSDLSKRSEVPTSLSSTHF
jgi:transposase